MPLVFSQILVDTTDLSVNRNIQTYQIHLNQNTRTSHINMMDYRENLKTYLKNKIIVLVNRTIA